METWSPLFFADVEVGMQSVEWIFSVFSGEELEDKLASIGYSVQEIRDPEAIRKEMEE